MDLSRVSGSNGIQIGNAVTVQSSDLNPTQPPTTVSTPSKYLSFDRHTSHYKPNGHCLPKVEKPTRRETQRSLAQGVMPLPDERPRPSVANLIGKFEIQNKRLSVSASSPSRSSSVVSHTTGDSSKEETKEKREWPPKSVVESSMRQSHVVTSFSPRPTPPPLTTSTSSEKTDGSVALDLEVPLTAKALNSSQMQAKADPEAFLENWRKDLPPETAMESTEEPPVTAKPTVQEPASAVTPTPSATKKLASTAPPRTPKASMTKAAPAPKATGPTSKPPVSSTPAKPAAAKAPVRTSTTAKPALTATPLKPQHTGQSVVSTASARKPAIKALAPPKTPSRSESATRAKTPITASRPKTPSSGLFAPTAASLARSRNAAPPVPTPVKKATLSSSAMDRLSKPTAASQARIAAAAGPPPSSFRPTPASTARSAAASTAKPKPAAAATPRKEPVKKDRVPSKQEAKPAEAPSATVEPESVAAASAVSLASSTTLSSTADVQENAPEDVFMEEENLAAPPEHFDEPEGPVDNDVTPRSPSPPAPAEVIITSEAEAGDTPVDDDSLEEQDDEPAAATENGNGAAAHKDDLEDIVNLLESTSIAKNGATDTTEDIPEELSEIPDEEEK
ncbi:hypothetical protein D9619_004813 [Psilocybe cf. subviscida]|uniref:Uncharacterized protein n=1 Tax=Psilocybe cf. subviscida TaxID=2480587 RepID=A0A8H5F8E0_9AGAR|nr:hypothetical protein D9619_004813 [Psilocybe cf. subviscida]